MSVSGSSKQWLGLSWISVQEKVRFCLHTCIVKLIVTWCTTPAVGLRDVVLSAIHTSNVKRNFYTLSEYLKWRLVRQKVGINVMLYNAQRHFAYTKRVFPYLLKHQTSFLAVCRYVNGQFGHHVFMHRAHMLQRKW